MKSKSYFGENRTGITTSPVDSKILIKFTKKRPPDIEASPAKAEKFRGSYITEENNLGSVPLPSNFKGMVNTLKEKLTGTAIETFIDKLGERLAFERNGVRLYELIKIKVKMLLKKIQNS